MGNEEEKPAEFEEEKPAEVEEEKPAEVEEKPAEVEEEKPAEAEEEKPAEVEAEKPAEEEKPAEVEEEKPAAVKKTAMADGGAPVISSGEVVQWNESRMPENWESSQVIMIFESFASAGVIPDDSIADALRCLGLYV